MTYQCAVCTHPIVWDEKNTDTTKVYTVTQKNDVVRMCRDCFMRVRICTYCGEFAGEQPTYMSNDKFRYDKSTSLCCEECLDKLDRYGKKYLGEEGGSHEEEMNVGPWRNAVYRLSKENLHLQGCNRELITQVMFLNLLISIWKHSKMTVLNLELFQQ